MAKIAEGAGMEVRMFFRDQNKDIMSEFLKDGEFESIPTIVLYDGDHNELGHWIERPALANEEMGPLRDIMAGKEQGSPEWEAARPASWTRRGRTRSTGGTPSSQSSAPCSRAPSATSRSRPQRPRLRLSPPPRR